MSSNRRRLFIWPLPITITLLSGLVLADWASIATIPFPNALYPGFTPDGAPSNDWAAGPITGSVVFQLSEANCYGLDIDFGEIKSLAFFI